MDITLCALTRPATGIDSCANEPIHTPNVIQGHGAVIVADVDTHRITHASANLEQVLGRTPGSVIGRALDQVIGKTAIPLMEAEAASGAGSIGEVIGVHGSGEGVINLQAHRTGSHIFIDLQPAMAADAASPLLAVSSVLETFLHATSIGRLCALAADGLRVVSGFDRVMAYRFGPEGEGEIIAESKIAALESLVGMTYPAADIPPQARALFLQSRVGSIADTSYEPVPLLVDPAFVDAAPIDMSRSALRGISTVHCEYLRNMNVAATLTISLVHREKLWGMIVCHHTTPRIAGPELRSVAKLLGQVLSLLIGNLGETEVYVDRLSRQSTLKTLVEAIAGQPSLLHGLRRESTALLRLVDAGGVAVRIAEKIVAFGKLPPVPFRGEAFALLERLSAGTIFGVDDLGARSHKFAGCVQTASGALIMPFGPNGRDAILWFRPELKRNVVWGGDPGNHHSIDEATGRLTPRASFEAWNETTCGRSAAWTEADLLVAGDLRIAIEAEMAAQASRSLARLRHFDPLTGLCNRRRLEEKLRELSSFGPGGPEIGVLFVDLDRFKAVNDSMGHAAGDQLLVDFTARLQQVVGPTHFVARLGGDEFVVLALGLDHAGMDNLAEGIRRSLDLPFTLGGQSVFVSVSIGLARADEVDKLDILQAADMAMYEAKQSGGNGVATFRQSLHDQALRKFELDHDLRTAIKESEQLTLVYQPLCDINDAQFTVLGFEALLRWHHPRLGWVSPDKFIPIAESVPIRLSQTPTRYSGVVPVT